MLQQYAIIFVIVDACASLELGWCLKTVEILCFHSFFFFFDRMKQESQVYWLESL